MKIQLSLLLASLLSFSTLANHGHSSKTEPVDAEPNQQLTVQPTAAGSKATKNTLPDWTNGWQQHHRNGGNN